MPDLPLYYQHYSAPKTVIESVALERGGFMFRDECVLGTRMQLLVVAAHFSIARCAADTVRAEIDRLNAILNDRDPASELSALNRTNEHHASTDLFAVVAAAEHWREISNGAFSGRLGHVLALWRHAHDKLPSIAQLADLAAAANDAQVELETTSRCIVRPDAVQFAFDAFAKGWIVDRAYEAARKVFGVHGVLLDIGGDIRAGGQAPDGITWPVVIGDPQRRADNAPIVAMVHLRDGAVATSGRGARDYTIAGKHYATTLSPFDGWPVENAIATTVIAGSAAEADALATALLVASDNQARELIADRGAAARITRANNLVAQLGNAGESGGFVPGERQDQNARSEQWHPGWQALATFTAPRRQLMRDPYFRSPYMAMWITDTNNSPVRTLLLVGTYAPWQKDNFIWWSMNRGDNDRLMAIRSMSTSAAGIYNVFWDGVDDAGNPVPPGRYILHVETSRERGKHTYRSLTLDFSEAKRFVEELEPTEEGGGLRVSFDHY